MQVIRIQAKRTGKKAVKAEKDWRWYNRRYGGKSGAKGLPRHIIAEYDRIHSRNKSK